MKKIIIYQKKEKVNRFLKLLMIKNKLLFKYIKGGWAGLRLIISKIKPFLSRNLNNYDIIFNEEFILNLQI